MDISGMSTFLNYNLQVKTGNCTVSRENWERNDFPFWKYFAENTDSTILNNLKPKGMDVSEWSSYPQNGAKSIGDAQITILMPESLQKKMEIDREYAAQIMKKVSDWKTNYDCTDMAIGMSMGETSFEAKMALQTGSYLIELDESGNVENYVVSTNSTQHFSTHHNSKEIKCKDKEKIKDYTDTTKVMNVFSQQLEHMENEPDYIVAMQILCSGIRRI